MATKNNPIRSKDPIIFDDQKAERRSGNGNKKLMMAAQLPRNRKIRSPSAIKFERRSGNEAKNDGIVLRYK